MTLSPKIKLSCCFLVMAVSIMAALNCFADKNRLNHPHTYQNPTGTVFPLVFCGGDDLPINNRLLTRLQSNGFNIAYLPSMAASEADNVMNEARVAQMKLEFNLDPHLDSVAIVDAVMLYRNNPYIVGWHLGDAADILDFSNLWLRKSWIADSIKNNQYIYTEMLNMTVSPDSMYAQGYPCYLGEYRMSLVPDIFCYEINPLEDDSRMERHTVNPYLFQNLKIVSDSSFRFNTPMWTTVLIDRETVGDNIGLIPLQAYSGIAHGTKSLRFKTNSQMPSDSAMIAAAKVNSRISQYSDTFLALKPNVVWHTDAIPQIQFVVPFPSINTSAGNAGVLASSFDYDGSHYIFIVNKDFRAAQDVSLEYTSLISLSISFIDGIATNLNIGTIIPGPTNPIKYAKNLHIEPGCACLIEWNEKN